MEPIIVIPCHSQDAPRAERLLDHLLYLRERQPEGFGVVVLSPDVPQEQRDKLRITAELVFKHCEVLNVKELPKSPDTKDEVVDAMFGEAAKLIHRAYRNIWLWLEPDSTPAATDWDVSLLSDYYMQPKRYMGGHMKYGSNEAKFLTRTAIYPQDAYRDFEMAQSLNIPFKFYAFGMSTKTPLIQNTVINSVDDLTKLRPDAILIHGDKSGDVIGLVKDKTTPKPIFPVVEERHVVEIPPPSPEPFTLKQKRRRKAKNTLDCVATNGCKSAPETVQAL